MALKGMKERTKDVDVLLPSEGALGAVERALRAAGFHPPRFQGPEYQRLGARSILVDAEGFSFDLFVQLVAGKFRLTPSVRSRAQPWQRIGRVRVLLASDEDLFLSKAITDRRGDLDDMASLYRRGLDEEVIIRECETQDEHGRMLWEAYLAVRLEELERHADLTVPWRERVRRIAERKLEGS